MTLAAAYPSPAMYDLRTEAVSGNPVVKVKMLQTGDGLSLSRVDVCTAPLCELRQ